jgi:NAD-dependent SIR2 family protein deacetylase
VAANHLTTAELEAGLADIRESPTDTGVLRMIVRRPRTEQRETLQEGELDLVEGLVGDNWRTRGNPHNADGAAHPDTQLNVMNARVIALVAQTPERWPLAGDQLFVDLDLSEANLPPGSRLAIGSAIIEVTAEPHTGCSKFRARFGLDAMRFVNSAVGKQLHMRGINARVVQPGKIKVGHVVRKVTEVFPALLVSFDQARERAKGLTMAGGYDPLLALDSRLVQAAQAIRSADALLIGAGAGMGVDSGLPDFRGNKGFWTAYPPFRGRSFVEIATPSLFERDPAEAWGFYGHRLNLYRKTTPHDGFSILRRWGEKRSLGYFVFTSNVDGHFQKSGFAEHHILECHGSIHHLQCTRVCSSAIWPADDRHLDVDETTIRCRSALPLCPCCKSVARPNILMFGDRGWLWYRYKEQRLRYANWLEKVQDANVVVVELGAGSAIPTVREECELRGRTLIRINPREADTPAGGIPLPLNALDALAQIDKYVQSEG